MSAVRLACLFLAAGPVFAAEESSSLTEALRNADVSVLPHETEEQRERNRRMLSEDFRERRRAANVADVQTWRSLKTREQWERLRDERIARLKASLGTFPEPPDDLHVRITNTIEGDGYTIDNVVFESRPGLFVTANLYKPARLRESMPGILICHSHHRPKTQGELSDMGVMWARAGCCVLVMDQLGHGERRQHPFASADDFDGEFRVSRQDYYFRYVVGMQLHLLGDSLIGWMAWDLMRGVDLLTSLDGVDEDRILLLGAVAGGGDPAAVTAALDPRIDGLVPFNFGGPQPETVYPLPEDAELAFNYFGGGSWESTRNLRRSIGDGFPHWLIVASVAPRPLIHAHEFAWDGERDPVWRRYQHIWGEFYGEPDHLAVVHGSGSVRGSGPESTHCTNIGRRHREAGIHDAFREWFGIAAEESSTNVDEQRLLALRRPNGETLSIPPAHELMSRLADERAAAFRDRLPEDRAARRKALREAWSDVLGDVQPEADAPVIGRDRQRVDGAVMQRLVCRLDGGIEVPFVTLAPAKPRAGKRPIVIALSQHGKQRFSKERADVVAELLAAGNTVCIPDLRGIGETRPGDYRGRRSYATGLSSSELMLGRTLVGLRLRDLRTLMAHLRGRDDFDGRFALWADSFAPVNEPESDVAVPLGIDDEPDQAEPLGHVLALLCGLYEDDVAAIVSARGGLTSFRSALDGQFVTLPHDLVVPGAIAVGDLPTLAEAFAPRPLAVARLVNAVDNRVPPKEASRVYPQAVVADEEPAALAEWLVERLEER